MLSGRRRLGNSLVVPTFLLKTLRGSLICQVIYWAKSSVIICFFSPAMGYCRVLNLAKLYGNVQLPPLTGTVRLWLGKACHNPKISYINLRNSLWNSADGEKRRAWDGAGPGLNLWELTSKLVCTEFPADGRQLVAPAAVYSPLGISLWYTVYLNKHHNNCTLFFYYVCLVIEWTCHCAFPADIRILCLSRGGEDISDIVCPFVAPQMRFSVIVFLFTTLWCLPVEWASPCIGYHLRRLTSTFHFNIRLKVSHFLGTCLIGILIHGLIRPLTNDSTFSFQRVQLFLSRSSD